MRLLKVLLATLALGLPAANAAASDIYFLWQLWPGNDSGEGFDTLPDKPDKARYEYPAQRQSVALGFKTGETVGLDVAYEVTFCGLECFLEDLFHSKQTIFQANGFNLLGYYRWKGWEFGAGALYYPEPYEKVTDSEGDVRERINFRSTQGALLKVEKHLRDFIIGVRYEDVTFKADRQLTLASGESTREVDAARAVVVIGFKF